MSHQATRASLVHDSSDQEVSPVLQIQLKASSQLLLSVTQSHNSITINLKRKSYLQCEIKNCDTVCVTVVVCSDGAQLSQFSEKHQGYSC